MITNLFMQNFLNIILISYNFNIDFNQIFCTLFLFNEEITLLPLSRGCGRVFSPKNKSVWFSLCCESCQDWYLLSCSRSIFCEWDISHVRNIVPVFVAVIARRSWLFSYNKSSGLLKDLPSSFPFNCWIIGWQSATSCWEYCSHLTKVKCH